MEDNNTFLLDLKDRLKKQNLIPNGICEICGELNPSALKIFEEHHLFSRWFSDEKCCLCLNCHATITAVQDALPPKLRSRKLPLKYRLPFVLLSTAALEKRIAEVKIRVTNQFYEEVLKEWIK